MPSFAVSQAAMRAVIDATSDRVAARVVVPGTRGNVTSAGYALMSMHYLEQPWSAYSAGRLRGRELCDRMPAT